MISRIILCSWLALLNLSIFAQSSSISGAVIDAVSKEPLVYAAITTGNKGVYANENGRFVLQLPVISSGNSWRAEIRISYLGYRDTTLILSEKDIQEFIEVSLHSTATLPTVDVSAGNKRAGFSASLLRPKVEILKTMPALLGETDILKSLVFLPGISTGLEGTGNIQIRGGNPSQTHLLLDGIQLYNAGHLGGFLSSVDPFGVRDISIYKGGIPARYGGRLSGVLDINLRRGDRSEKRSEFFLGTATVRAGQEGPVGSKGSYVISGRLSYPSLVVSAFRLGSYKSGEEGSITNVLLNDASAKLSWDYGNRQISLFGYLSGDRGVVQSDAGFTLTNEKYRWGTFALGTTLTQTVATKGVWTNRVYYSSYGYKFTDREESNRQTADPFRKKTEQRTRLRDLNLDSRISWQLSNQLNLRAGVHLTNHDFTSRVETENDDIPEPLILLNDRNAAVEIATFGEFEFSGIDDRLRINSGLRLTNLSKDGTSWRFEPRLNLSLRMLGNTFLNAGYDRNNQYIHQLTTDLSILPSDIWILADKEFGPSSSTQIYVGVGGEFGDDAWNWSVEVFRKELAELITLRDRSADIFSIPEQYRSAIAAQGSGDVKGLEFYLAKYGDRLSGTLAYTWSVSNRKFPTINSGETFPYTFDRTHDGAITLQYKLTNGWSLSTAFVYQTGQAVTFPVAATADYFIYDRVNNARVQDYHRLDLTLRRSYRAKKNNRRRNTLIFSIYNLYSRANPVDFRVEPTTKTAIDPNTGLSVLVEGYQARQVSLFPIVPSIGYQINLE